MAKNRKQAHKKSKNAGNNVGKKNVSVIDAGNANMETPGDESEQTVELLPVEPDDLSEQDADYVRYMIVFNVLCLYFTVFKLIFVLADSSWTMDSYGIPLDSGTLSTYRNEVMAWVSILFVFYGLAMFVLGRYRHSI